MDNPDRVTYFAATDSRGKRTPFGIKAKDRSRHMYVIGKTGMGKSTMLENMAIQDLRNGEGIAFIDPHGGTADKLLEYVPKERIKDVVYFAPFDLDQPIAFNVMEDVGYDKRHLVVSGLMATFKKIWEDAWSARMEYILTNTLLALLEYPDATLLSVNRMYTDKNYRKKVVENIKDPVVKDFWVTEYANYGDRYTQEATPAIQNKIGQFTGNPLIRNIIGQSKSSFDIREMMDQKKILIINLSKGQVGETNMRLLGSMLTTRIFLAAMSRADLSGVDLAKLAPFYFYVDEFQNFANDTFAEILSEARKYHLNLIIAHQYVEQMEEQVRAAVFGNVGTTVAFRVGPFDAEVLETIFMPEFEKDDLVNLGYTQIYLTLMIDGVGSRPFSALTIPPIAPPPVTHKAEVIQSSRQQFGALRSSIEDAVRKELEVDAAAAMSEPKAKPKDYRPAPSAVRKEGFEQRPQVSLSQPRASASQSRPPLERNDKPRDDVRRNESHSATQVTEQRVEHREHSPQAPAAKTSEDLKNILRSMTATTEKKPLVSKFPVPGERSPLKSALADVLKKNEPHRSSKQEEKPKMQEPQEELTEKTYKKSSGTKPFEVPEETLKALFKDK
jgi:hypothetical protein